MNKPSPEDDIRRIETLMRTYIEGGRTGSIDTLRPILKEPLNNPAWARRRLCGRLRLGLGERGLVVPNERAQTRRRPRKGAVPKGFAGKAASRAFAPRP